MAPGYYICLLLMYCNPSSPLHVPGESGDLRSDSTLYFVTSKVHVHVQPQVHVLPGTAGDIFLVNPWVGPWPKTLGTCGQSPGVCMTTGLKRLESWHISQNISSLSWLQLLITYNTSGSTIKRDSCRYKLGHETSTTCDLYAKDHCSWDVRNCKLDTTYYLSVTYFKMIWYNANFIKNFIIPSKTMKHLNPNIKMKNNPTAATKSYRKLLSYMLCKLHGQLKE